jgi:hypothetical protein
VVSRIISQDCVDLDLDLDQLNETCDARRNSAIGFADANNAAFSRLIYINAGYAFFSF